LDLKPGDEVITAFAATVEVIALLQLTRFSWCGFIQYEYLYRRN
jgi:hypothetical protein